MFLQIGRGFVRQRIGNVGNVLVGYSEAPIDASNGYEASNWAV